MRSVAAERQHGLSLGVTLQDIFLWSGAAAVMLAVHALSLSYLSGMTPSGPPPAEAAPAVMLDLAPVVTAPEAVPTDMAELVDSVSADPVDEFVEDAEPVPDPTPVAEPVTDAEPLTEPPVPEVVPETVDPVQEVAEAETPDPVEEVSEVEPVEPVVETAETVVDSPIEEIVPDLVEVPLPEVALAVPTEKPVVEQEPEPKPARKAVEKSEKKPVKKVVKKPAKKPAPPPQNASKKSATASAKTAAPKNNQGAAGTSMSPATWKSRVHARIMRQGRSKTDRGLVSVRFSITSAGAVTSVSIARSSGNGELDQAALDMVRRASPMPPPPPSIGKTITVPIKFGR